MAYGNEKADFVEWLKLGTKEMREAAGQPPTVVAWAKANNVSRVTCERWKNDPDVKRAVVDHGVTLFTVDEIKRARDKLVSRALDDGNVQAIKMILQLSGAMDESDEPRDDAEAVNKYAGMSDAEIEAMLTEDDE